MKGDEVKENSPFRIRFVYAAPTAWADSVNPDVGVSFPLRPFLIQ